MLDFINILRIQPFRPLMDDFLQSIWSVFVFHLKIAALCLNINLFLQKRHFPGFKSDQLIRELSLLMNRNELNNVKASLPAGSP